MSRHNSSVLGRLRELGRRLGDAIDAQLRPEPQRRVPAPVPVDVEPKVRRQPEGSR